MAIATILVGVYQIPITSIALATVSGVFLILGYLLVYKSLETQQVSNSYVIGELSPAILTIFGIFVLSEPVSNVQLLSIMTIFIGTAFLITTSKLKINRLLIPALMGSASWAIYWILINYSISTSGTFALPLLLSRVIATFVMAGYLFANRKKVLANIKSNKDKKNRRMLVLLLCLAFIVALLDSSGDAVFSYVISLNQLAIGSALSALTPMFVSFLGVIIYKDRFTKLEFIGLVVMIIGALALSVL